MRLRRINIPLFVFNRLPLHKRDAPRVTLFTALLCPFTIMMQEFLTWRAGVITRLNVSGQTASIQWYLNELYDPTLRRIEIKTATVTGVSAGLEFSEPADYVVAGLSGTEPASYAAVPLPGEDTIYGFYSFVILIPADIVLLSSKVAATMDKYRTAGRSYKILIS